MLWKNTTFRKLSAKRETDTPFKVASLMWKLHTKISVLIELFWKWCFGTPVSVFLEIWLCILEAEVWVYFARYLWACMSSNSCASWIISCPHLPVLYLASFSEGSLCIPKNWEHWSGSSLYLFFPQSVLIGLYFNLSIQKF